MSAGGLVLDLDSDEPADAPATARRSRGPEVPLWVVGAVAVVVAAAAVGLTHARDADRELRERHETVTLMVSVPPRITTAIGGGGDGGTWYRTGLRVYNAGPEPVDVGTITTVNGGVLVHSVIDGGQTVPPASFRDIEVRIAQECTRWRSTEPNVPVTLRIEAMGADEVQRTRVLDLPIRDTWWWQNLLAPNCTA